MTEPVTILRVRNPAALELPDIRALIDAAFANVTCPIAKTFMFEMAGDDNYAIFLARVGDKWRGLAWMRNSGRDDDRSACVLHFYCRNAGRGLREALVKTVVDFAREGGMESLMAWDINRKPRAFRRIFKSAGPSKEMIRAYEFDLMGALTDETDST